MPLVILTLFSLFLRLSLLTSIYSGDLNNHTGWGYSNLSSGFKGAYDRQYTGIMQPTYPPLALYAFTTSTGLYDLSFKISRQLNASFSLFPSQLIWWFEDQDTLPAFNKIIAIASDIGIGVLIYSFVRFLRPKSKIIALLSAGAYLLNPAVWYTSAIWGQIESFPLFFILLCLWLILRGKSSLSHVAFVAALLAKQTSLIFGLLILPLQYKKFGFVSVLKGLLLQFIIFYLAYLPFSPTLSPVWPISVYINRLQTGSGSNWISDHAFNAWIWYSHLAKIPDTTPVVLGISAGLIGLIVSGLLLFLPAWRYLKSPINWHRTFIFGSTLPLIAFTFLTKMHERYSAPALSFLAVVSAINPFSWILYFALSIVHLINLYHEWYFPNISYIKQLVMQWSTIQICSLVFVSITLILIWKNLRER